MRVLFQVCRLLLVCAVLVSPLHGACAPSWLGSAPAADFSLGNALIVARKADREIQIFPSTHTRFESWKQTLNPLAVQRLEAADVLFTEYTEGDTPPLPNWLGNWIREYGRDGYALNAQARAKFAAFSAQLRLANSFTSAVLHKPPLGASATIRMAALDVFRRGARLWPELDDGLMQGGDDLLLLRIAQQRLKKPIFALEARHVHHFLYAELCEEEATNSDYLISVVDNYSNEKLNRAFFEHHRSSGDGRLHLLSAEGSYMSLLISHPSLAIEHRCHVAPRNLLWVERVEQVMFEHGYRKAFMPVGVNHLYRSQLGHDDTLLHELVRSGYSLDFMSLK